MGRQAENRASQDPRRKFNVQEEQDPRPILGRGKSLGVGPGTRADTYAIVDIG